MLLHTIKILVALYSLTLLATVGCLSSSARLNAENVNAPKVTTPSTSKIVSSKWESLPIPVEADILVSNDTGLFLVGSEGPIRLRSDLTFQRSLPPQTIQEYFSKDGGITLLPSTDGTAKSNISPFSTSRICSTESALVNNERLIATGPCEHTSQLRAYTLSGKDDLATVINFTYSTNSTDDDPKVYGPGRLFSTGGRDYATTTSVDGPIILQIETRPFRQKIVWKRRAPDTAILSVFQIEGFNYMLTSDGMIMRSENDLGNWTFFSKVPDEFKGKVFDLKFRSSTEAYIIGEEGILLASRDGGKNWSQRSTKTGGSLYKISFDANRIAILVDFKTLMVSEDSLEWKELNLDKDFARIDDIRFFDHKLFVLTPEAVFVNSFAN